MPLARRLSALLLLAAFVAGGLVAPVAHQAEHERAHQRHLEARRLAHAGHLHDGGPALEAGTAELAAHAPCLLCYVRGDAPTVEASVLALPLFDASPASAAVASKSGPSLQHFLIRGPPLSA